jgi:import inner membrane translocase subunit TIM44
MFKELDPTFQQESFLKELREYIVPEIVDALISRDFKTLKEWLSEAPYTVLTHNMQSLAPTLISESRVLDIRNVDMVKAQVLENEVPVFVVSFHSQEVHCFRDPKTGAIVSGADDRVKSVAYVAVLTRLEEELDNAETGGWKIIDIARQELS